MLLVLFVMLFTCGDGVTGGVKRAIERALVAAGTGGASSSAGESHVQQLGGGVRRCLRQEDQPQLPLLSNLRRRWAEVSSVTVQELAHSAASQGAHGMEGAASAGQGGRQPKNLHRDLMTLFGTPRGAPALTWLRIPMRSGPDIHPVLLPHVFFSKLFEHHRSLWEESIRGPPGAAREFRRALTTLGRCQSETILICQERAGPRLFRWVCLAMQALSQSKTVHSSFLGTHCCVLPRTKVSDGGGSSQ